ncbi:MAG TPA: methyltransferase [Kofleriaceae bacterium]|nr:methyltransferase [Kofleriaceae bacterium]
MDLQKNAYEAIAGMITGYRQTALLHVAARLKVFDALKPGPLAIDELARQVGALTAPLHVILRGVTNLGLVNELEDGRFTLAPPGELLCSTAASGLHGMAVYMGGLSAKAYTGLYAAVRDGGIAFDHAYGVGFYEHLKTDPEINDAYNKTLAFGGAAAMLLLSGYDFAGIKTLVDVGGADGTLAIAILQKHKAMHAIVFDKPEFVQAAAPQIRAAGVGDRCTVAPGDFFEGVPRGGDAYMLARIITNWSEARALQILAKCREAMPADGKLLIMEQVLPERVEKGNLAIEGDLNVFAHLGGHVRTLAEFGELLGRAGFKIVRPIPLAPVLRRGFHVLECTLA